MANSDMAAIPWWARENFWKKSAVWITAFMAAVLLLLTFDTMTKISADGAGNVPRYSVINQRVYYRFDPRRNVQAPVIGDAAPLFGEALSEEDAQAMVSYGKKIVQGRNCMNCHTLLGNGAYFAPDLTKAWLDPAWGVEESREAMMLAFLQDPVANRRGGGIGRVMPDLNISEEEARAIIAFLKWMAAIDTNGFPYNFPPIAQRGDK
jgi:nitric oxide reductase subunit C